MKRVYKLLFCAAITSVFCGTSFAQKPDWVVPLPDIEGNPEAGLAKAESCVQCHGAEGMSTHNYFPVLAGQIEEYTLQQLHDYRSEKRNHPLMTPITQSLTDTDIADISAYYAGLEVARVTPVDPESRRWIRHVKGKLFQVQDDNNTFSSFLVTPDGIILTDPITQKAAAWTSEEIKRRFDVPVKYVIYSHHHDDHAPGAEYFEDAIIVAHENAVQALAAEPDNPAVPPHLTFSDRLTISLGGEQVNLVYIGKSHTDNLIVVHYPTERAVLAVDSLWINRVAYGDLGHSSHFPHWVEALNVIDAIDFDTLLVAHGHYGKAPGYGTIGTKADVTRFKEYFEALWAAVKTAKQQGLSLEETVDGVELEQFSDMDMYDKWFKLNVKGVYLNSPDQED